MLKDNGRACAESLEARRMLYGSYVLDGVLNVDGDAFDETIRVYAEPGSSLMTVEVTSQPTAAFPLASFNKVVITAYDGNDTVFAEQNNNPTGKDFEIYGNNGNDVIYGSLGNDFIRGGNGDDLISGRGGNDYVYGDDGRDTINGDEGNDTLYGNWGGDVIYGGIGDDSVLAGLGLDTVYGGDGADTLLAGNGADSVYGDAGNDYIEGRGKSDTLFGGDGNDTIVAGAGADLVSGDAGDDLLYATSSLLFVDTLNGGLGTDGYEADSNDVLIGVEYPIAPI